MYFCLAYICGVRQVVDPNPYPPGLHQHSIVLVTPQREVKITAATQDRHKLWYDAIQYLIARRNEDSALGDTARSTENVMQTPDSIASGSLGQRFKRKYSVATMGSGREGRSVASDLYDLGSRSEPYLAGAENSSNGKHQNKLRMSTASGFLLKRPETPAAEYMAAMENASPRSIRSYSTQDFAHELGDDIISVADEEEDGEGYEGLENVRVCCGEHDINQLSAHRHDYDSHRHQRRSSNLPQPSRASSRMSQENNSLSRRGKKSLGSLFSS